MDNPLLCEKKRSGVNVRFWWSFEKKRLFSRSSDLTCSSKNGVPRKLHLLFATANRLTKVQDLSSSEVWLVRVTLKRIGTLDFFCNCECLKLGSLFGIREFSMKSSAKIGNRNIQNWNLGITIEKIYDFYFRWSWGVVWWFWCVKVRKQAKRSNGVSMRSLMKHIFFESRVCVCVFSGLSGFDWWLSKRS